MGTTRVLPNPGGNQENQNHQKDMWFGFREIPEHKQTTLVPGRAGVCCGLRRRGRSSGSTVAQMRRSLRRRRRRRECDRQDQQQGGRPRKGPCYGGTLARVRTHFRYN